MIVLKHRGWIWDKDNGETSSLLRIEFPGENVQQDLTLQVTTRSLMRSDGVDVQVEVESYGISQPMLKVNLFTVLLDETPDIVAAATSALSETLNMRLGQVFGEQDPSDEILLNLSTLCFLYGIRVKVEWEAFRERLKERPQEPGLKVGIRK